MSNYMKRRSGRARTTKGGRRARKTGRLDCSLHVRPLRFEWMEERTLLSADFQFHHVIYSGGAGPSASTIGPVVSAPLASSAPVGMTPQQIRTAYGIDSIMLGSLTGDGTGQTIAIIDAYDAPNLVSSTDPGFATSDLYKFDHTPQINLPDPPSFVKLNETGGTTMPSPSGSTGWAVETCLDVEWAHAIAPKANIVLFEANSPSDADLISTAVNTARNYPGVTAISMSFGRSEESVDPSLTSVFNTPAGHPGVTFLASTGDDGAPGGFPAYAPNVVAVGGTTLTINPATNAWVNETGWSDGGGGQSAYEAKPSYQNAVNTSAYRQIPDIAFDADPASGVAILDSYDFGSATPWIQVGGTSVSSPCWAGLIAIGNQLRTSVGLPTMDGLTQTLPLLYSMKAGDFHDIISGNNGFPAKAGYDEVTGIGSPIANKLVPDFVPVSSKGTVNFSTRSYEIGSSPSIRVTDLDLIASPSATVTLTSTTGDSETLALPAQGGGIFSGSIVTSNGSVTPGDGILEVAPGATITVTYNDANDGTGHPATVTDQATMFQVDHYAFTTISSPETASVPFAVTVDAYDSSNNLITGYNGTATLTASGQAGSLPISLTSVTFVSGVWTGNVSVNALDPTVTLGVNNGTGAVGTSNVFATQAGPVASFQYSTIASPQYQNVAFPVTATAKDANGYTVTNFNGSATLTGWTGGGAAGITPPPAGTPITTGNVKLLGTDLQLGVDADASLITQDDTLGAKFLGDEFLVPGTPQASFTLAVNGSDYHNNQPAGSSAIPMTVSDVSAGGFLHAQAVGNIAGIHILRDIWFRPSDHAVTFQVTLQNTTGAALNNVAWLENYDPDQGYALTGDYSTANDVLFGGKYVEAVYRYSPTYPNGLTIGMGSDDPRAVASADGFDMTNPFQVINTPVDPNGAMADIASNLAFNVGTLGAGASTTMTYFMVFAPDRQVAANLYQAQLRTAVPVTPTTVTFVNGQWTGNVTVQQAATGMYLQMDDGAGHVSTSGTFNTITGAPLIVSVPANATEGDTGLTGTISVPIAPASNLSVTLASSDSGRVTVPANVTILAGQTSVSFPVTVVDNTLLDGPEAVTINATTTAPNYAPGSGSISVHDNETATVTVNLPSTANETDGTLAGTVTSDQAPSKDITVQLTSSVPGRISVPATVILPAGHTSVSFNATVVDDHVIESGPTSITVTPQVENWTTHAATVSLLDNDRTITITVPASGWEGQTLAGAGTVLLGGTLSSNVVVSLFSSNTAELTVPSTVTVLAGQRSATFDVMLHDNGLRQGPQTVQVMAATNDFPPVLPASVVVKDVDVDHFAFDTIGSTETAGVPFSVTARAFDCLNNPILVYAGTLPLTASGSSGSLPITPTSATFASGVWTGNVTINAVDPTVTLHVDAGAGVVGTSNAFAVQAGPMASLQWSTVASPEYQNNPFPVTLTAKDANGYTATGFNGPATLSGSVGTTTTATWLGKPTPDVNFNTGTWTLGWSFTPTSTILVTDVLHYYGSKISIWTDSGTLLTSQTYAMAGPGWADTPLATPVQLLGGTTYRIGCYTAGQNYYRWTTTTHVFPLGTIGQDYMTSGDGFPVTHEGNQWYIMDFVAQVSSATSVPITPTTANFVNGVWTGNVKVLQAVAGMHLHVDDGSGHTSDSNTFDTLPVPLSVTLPANATEGDGTAMGTVSVLVAPTTDLVVNLTSADTTRITVPASVTIPAGQTAVALPLTIVDNSFLDGPEVVAINATTAAAGYTAGSGSITVHDNETAVLTVNLPTTAHETDGTLAGTVTASQAPTRNITVTLGSDNISHLSVPATVTILAGHTSASFTATVVDDHVIESSPMPITVTAQVENWTTGSTTVSLLDSDNTMTITLPASGWEGQTLSGAGTVRLGGTLSTALVVNLASSDNAELTVPLTVTIPAGQRSVTFDVMLHDNGLRQGPQTEQITATAGGFAPVQASMVVKDADVDHFAFDTIGGAKAAGVPFSVTARALDYLNNPILVYAGSVPLTASGDSGSLSIAPTAITFASGVWTGNVTVGTADTNVVLRLDNGAGAVGTSNPLTVLPKLQVVSTTPGSGGAFNLPAPFTYDVNFNEPVLPSSVTTSSLVLSGIAGATVTGATLLPGNTTARFTISGITTEGTLNASISTITDPSGNPGTPFSASYYVDIGTVAFPVPLTSPSTWAPPGGSLIYSGSTTGMIGPAGDTDSFTISLDAGQTITALVHPASGLQPTVQVLGPGGTVIGTASASAAGSEAVVQTAAVPTAGVYTIVVGSAGSTVGAYTTQVYLNTALESESHNGPTNNTPATAQNISGSFVSLGAGASRGAVLGTTDPSAGDYYALSLSAGDSVTVGVSGLFASTLHVSLTDASGTVLALGTPGASNLQEVISDFAVTSSGTYNVLVSGTASMNYSLVVTRDASFDTEPNNSLATAQPIQSTAVGGQQMVLGYVDTVGATTGVEPDNYPAGTVLTNIVPGITLTAQGSSAAITSQTSAYRSTGTRVFAYGSNTMFSDEIGLKAAFATPVSSVSLDLVADDSYDPGYMKAYNSSGVLLQDLETGPPAYPTPGFLTMTITRPTADIAYIVAGGQAGQIIYFDNLVVNGSSPVGDYYSIAVNAGDPLVISTTTPADGPNQFVNTLDPKIELYNPSGTLVASDDNSGADGRNALLHYTAAAAGQYVVHVLSAGGTTGEYVLDVGGATGTTAQAFSVASTNPANGSTIASYPATMTVDFSGTVLLSSLAASDLTVNGVAATGFSVVDYNTVAFTLPAGTGDGTYTVAVAAGAVSDIHGTPLQAYGGQFTVDSVAPRVIGSSIQEGDALATSSVTYMVQFSKPMLKADLDASDFSLVGIHAGIDYTPTSFSYNRAGTSLTLYYTSVPEDQYTLTLLSGPGRFEDTAGLALDGEATAWPIPPNESGDGVPGGNFVVHFYRDTVPVATVSLGSHTPGKTDVLTATATKSDADGDAVTLNFVWKVNGVIKQTTLASTALTDTFSLSGKVNPGDTVSVEVTPNDPLLAGATVTDTATVSGPAVLPTVTNVVLSGTTWTPAFLSSLALLGSQNVGGYSIPVGGGSQLLTLPAGNIDQIKVTFSENVTVDQSDLLLTGVNTPSYDVADGTFSYDPVTFTATWTLPGPIGADKLMLALNADGSDAIHDDAGTRLDGDWANPASTTDTGTSAYPSGNGTAGGNFDFRFNVLPGDATQDAVVGPADMSRVLTNYGKTGVAWSQGDFSGDGVIGPADMSKLLANYGVTLPAGSPAAGTFPADVPLVASAVLSQPPVIADLGMAGLGGFLLLDSSMASAAVPPHVLLSAPAAPADTGATVGAITGGCVVSFAPMQPIRIANVLPAVTAGTEAALTGTPLVLVPSDASGTSIGLKVVDQARAHDAVLAAEIAASSATEAPWASDVADGRHSAGDLESDAVDSALAAYGDARFDV